MERSRPHIGTGNSHLHKIVEMILAYNRQRKYKSTAKLKTYRQQIYDYQLENNIELAAPISMHLK